MPGHAHPYTWDVALLLTSISDQQTDRTRVWDRFAFGALLAFALICPWQFSGFWPSTYDFWGQAVFLLLTSAACLFLALRGPITPRVPFTWQTWLLAAFTLWTLVTVVTAEYLHDAVLEAARVVAALCWYFLVRATWHRQRALPLVLALAAGVAWVCLPSMWDFVHTRNPRQFGPFYNPNLFANAIAMALPLAGVIPILVWRCYRQRWLALLSYLPFLILVPGLAVTSSKGGFLAAGIATVLTVSFILQAKKDTAGQMFKLYWPAIVATLLICGVGAGTLASITVIPRLRQTFGKEDNSTKFRLYTWKGTLAMAQARPVTGFGPGSFPYAYPRYAQAGYTRSAHQSWLQVAAESGFVALILLSATCLLALRRGLQALQGKDWPVAAGALGALIAYALHALTDSGWSISSVLFLLAVSLALLDRCSLQDGPECEPSPLPAEDSPEQGHAAGGLSYPWLAATFLLALGGYLTQKAATGETLRADAEAAARQGNWTQALRQGQASVAEDPYSSRLWLQYARLQSTTGQNPGAALQRALELQPGRSNNWLQLARFNENSPGPEADRAYDRAVELDPKNTNLRLERANWRLDRKDSRGYDDLKYIVGLLQQPYGMYPATPDFVNLDYARAAVLLVPRLRQEGTDSKVVAELLQTCLGQVKTYRANMDTHRQMEEAVGDQLSLPPLSTDIDVLETRLKNLQGSSN